MACLPTGTLSGLTSTSLRPERTRSRTSKPFRPRVLREAGISPAKSLGQHFLIDQGLAGRIVASAELTPDDTVIEVGPGTGVLTQRLVKAAGRVVAVELDSRLAQRLNDTLACMHPNLTVVQGDILATTPEELLSKGAARLITSASTAETSPSQSTTERRPRGEVSYVMVANLPYNIGAAVLRHFLEAEHPPRRLVVMLQREVADSICAAPGHLGLLGISVQVYAQPKRLFNVPARAFYPPPKVTSCVIRLDVRPEPLVPPEDLQRFFKTVRAGFSAPRKQLANSLSQGLSYPTAEARAAIAAAGIDPALRPQSLSIEQWRRLTQSLPDSGA